MSFYTDLVNGKYNTYEKVASVDNDSVKDALNELSTEQLNVLADELDVFSKEASEITLESSLFEDDEYVSYEIGKEAEEVEGYEEDVAEIEVEASEGEDEMEEPKKDKEKKESDISKEKSKEEAKKEKKEPSTPEGEGEEEVEKEAGFKLMKSTAVPLTPEEEKKLAHYEKLEDNSQGMNVLPPEQEEEYSRLFKKKYGKKIAPHFTKKADEDEEFEIVKEACEQVGDYLVENDLTIADYVYSLTGLEKQASHIGEMAEKVAMVYDIPVVMAARDLVSTMTELVNQE